MCVGWAVTGWTSESVRVSCSESLARPGPGGSAWPLQCGSVAPACPCPASVTMGLSSPIRGQDLAPADQWEARREEAARPWPETGPGPASVWERLLLDTQGLGRRTDRRRGSQPRSLITNKHVMDLPKQRSIWCPSTDDLLKLTKGHIILLTSLIKADKLIIKLTAHLCPFPFSDSHILTQMR